MKKYLLYLTILVWPFGLLLNLQTPFLQKPVYFLDILAIFLYIAFIINSKNRSEIVKSSIFKPFIIFISCLLLSLLANLYRLSFGQIITSVFYLIRIITYPSIYFVAISENKKDVAKAAFFSFGIFLTFALIQYFFIPDLRFLKSLGFDDHYYRLAGTLLDPNFTGAILSAVSFLLLFANQFLALTVTLASLALTFSRASFLSFIVALVFYAIAFKKYKPLVLVLLLSVGIYLAPKPFGEGVNLMRTFSIYSRMQNSQEGVSIFSQNPFFGTASPSSISNSFIYLLATYGAVGFLSFLNLLYSLFVNANRPAKTFLVAILTHSVFNNTLFFIWVYSLMWLVLALNPKENR